VSKLYAADLVGAALGCILVIYTLEITDGPTAVLVVAFLASLGATLFAVEAGRGRLIHTTGIATFVLALAAPGHVLLVRNGYPALRVVWVKHQLDTPHLHEEWNSFSRVTVDGDPRVPLLPAGWGLSPVCPADLRLRQVWFHIDGFAGTVLTYFKGDLSTLEHLKYDLTNLVHYIRPDSRMLVVGAGGGRDVLSALKFDQKEVVAVEINPNIVKILNKDFGNFSGHLDRYPNVRFVVDEARSYIARQKELFDIIQVSLVDTSAATAAGAFVLTENSLYTLEAWKIFLNRLTSRGVLSVSRMYLEEAPAEVYRLTSLASKTLMELGVGNPRDHVIVARTPARPMQGVPRKIVAVNILVSKTPFTEADLSAIEGIAREMRFELALSPRTFTDAILPKIASASELDTFTAQYPMNIAAPTDDSPFFFNMLRLRNAFSRDALKLGWWHFNVIAVYTLAALLVVVVGLTLLCIVVPLILRTDRTALRGALPLCAFFASIGFGFMLVEISQMQRLTILLGHPVYSLSVVLSTLLLSSGCGSYVTQLVRESTLKRSASILVLALVALLVTFGTLTPYAIREFESATTGVRIGVATAVLFPLGLFMGMAFPLGMKLAANRATALTPWLWGINGATSVCASVLAIAIALTAGISASFWTGTSCYVVALAALVWAARAPSR
jgi:hypothetical protein